MKGNNKMENISESGDDDIILKLKNLYISDTTEIHSKCEHAIVERFKRLTIGNVEDIDEDLVESLKTVLHIDDNGEKQNYYTCISNTKIEKCLIIVLLSKCEFPVTWNPIKAPPYDRPQLFIDKVRDKDEECEDTRQFKWVNFVLQLILVHELTNENKFSEAYAKTRELQYVFHTLENENCKDSLYLIYHNALHHVIMATEAYVLVKMNLLMKAKQVLKNIMPVDKMTKIQHAGILGLKAQVFMEYGFQSTKKCIEIIKEAIELDEFQAEWHFILGKAMGRIRRFNCYTSVDREEITALEKALDLEKNPCYIVYLAQVYREHEFVVYLQSRNINNTSVYREQMYKLILTSKRLIWKALELSPNSARINIRCALHLLKIPRIYGINISDRIKKCIDVASEKAPNNRMLHHVTGYYYRRIELDIEKAEKHLEIAARENTYGASIDLIKLRYRQNNEFDILKSLEGVLEQYTELERRCQTLAQIGSYYLFAKRDLLTSVEYYMKIINEYPQCETMKLHKVLFLRMSFPVNLYCVIITEINLWLSKNEDKNKNKILKYFVLKASLIDRNAVEESEKNKSSLVDKIIEESKEADKIAAVAEIHESITRKRIAKYLARNKNKKPKIQTNANENEQNESNINKTKNKKTNKNKKSTNKRSVNNKKGCKGLKRSHSASCIDASYREDLSVPKFILDMCKSCRKTDGSNSRSGEISIERHINSGNSFNKNLDKRRFGSTSNPEQGERYIRRLDCARSEDNEFSYNAISADKMHYHSRSNSCDESTIPWNVKCKGNRSRDSSVSRSELEFDLVSQHSSNNKGFSQERRNRGSRGEGRYQGRGSVDKINLGNSFNKNFDKRRFGSTSNLEQGKSYRRRLDSASSEDNEFSYNAISADKMRYHSRSNSCDESTIPWNVRCQGNRSRDSSLSRTELEFDLVNQQSSSNKGLSQERSRGSRGRGRGRGSVDKSGWMATRRSESVESLSAKIKNSNCFVPDFMQNK